MTKGILHQYKTLSPEDQMTFRRWAKANLAAALIVVAAAIVVKTSVSTLDVARSDQACPNPCQYAEGD
jgi:hypothetical protein